MGNPNVVMLKAKKFGVLLRAARLNRGKSIDDCAIILKIPVEVYEAFEFGEQSITLPQLEILALFLETPLDNFFDQHSLNNDQGINPDINLEKLIPLRQRMLGVIIRKIRLDLNLSIAGLSEKTGISTETLESYELGEKPIALHELETIAKSLNRSISDLQDHTGPIGRWLEQQSAVKGFLALPSELQGCVVKPAYRPYLEVAKRLSDMSTDKLRGVAEGLLEITL